MEEGRKESDKKGKIFVSPTFWIKAKLLLIDL